MDDFAAGARKFEFVWTNGQYVAAQHVSENLGIPIGALKAKMTGNNAVSLGKAIQQLRPDLPAGAAQSEVKAAEQAAKQAGKK